jgi:hypothetical protein
VLHTLRAAAPPSGSQTAFLTPAGAQQLGSMLLVCFVPLPSDTQAAHSHAKSGGALWIKGIATCGCSRPASAAVIVAESDTFCTRAPVPRHRADRLSTTL